MLWIILVITSCDNQPEGVGKLCMDNGTVLKPNKLYPLDKTFFCLYYTSDYVDQQVIDIYIEDSFGQVVQKTVKFQLGKVKPIPLDPLNPLKPLFTNPKRIKGVC